MAFQLLTSGTCFHCAEGIRRANVRPLGPQLARYRPCTLGTIYEGRLPARAESCPKAAPPLCAPLHPLRKIKACTKTWPSREKRADSEPGPCLTMPARSAQMHVLRWFQLRSFSSSFDGVGGRAPPQRVPPCSATQWQREATSTDERIRRVLRAESIEDQDARFDRIPIQLKQRPKKATVGAGTMLH